MNNYEKKTSKVVGAENLGTWRDLFKHHITMENGDIGTYFSKSEQQNKFVIGEQVDYLWDGPKNRIKPYFEQSQQTNTFTSKPKEDRELSIVRQSSLKVAMDYINVKGGDLADILETAEVLTDWVLTGKKIEKNDQGLPF